MINNLIYHWRFRLVNVHNAPQVNHIANFRANKAAKINSCPKDPADFSFPTIPSNQPYADRDADGMPDIWEAANGFDPATPDDSGDADNDGYTNLEEFLNLVDNGI